MMLRYWKELAVLALLVIVCVLGYQWNAEAEQRGVLQERVRVADSTISQVLPRLRRTDTLLMARIDTVTRTVTRVRTVLDTIRDTVIVNGEPHIAVDTATFNDTKVALKKCSDLTVTCSRYRYYADSVMKAQQVVIDARPRPPNIKTKLAWGAIGLIAGRASCSVK